MRLWLIWREQRAIDSREMGVVDIDVSFVPGIQRSSASRVGIKVYIYAHTSS